MKIAFLCSSIEPGKDGVGDYCRKLAVSLIASGHEAIIIALNDKFLSAGLKEIQHDENGEVLVYRYSYILTWKQKINYLQQLIAEYKPNWISLQYVSYGFDKKGLPFYLPKVLQPVSLNYNLHIMFHETWIGISTATPLMHKIYGYFQKQIAVALVKSLKPKSITTTNILYQLVLKEKNIEASCLPLFSNIDKLEKDEDYLSFIESKYSINLKDNSFYKLGIFGTLYPAANLSFVIPEFLEKKSPGKKTVIIIFGKNNRPEEVSKLKKNLKHAIIFAELGELSENKVSSIMSILDEAILCTPIEYIGKSGAYAALRLHNVKVEILSSLPIPAYEKEIINYNNYLAKRNSNQWNVEYISQKFISMLNS